MNLEKNLINLENLLSQLESENLTIDESLKIYEKAVKLANDSIEYIKNSKGKLEVLTKELDSIEFDFD